MKRFWLMASGSLQFPDTGLRWPGRDPDHASYALLIVLVRLLSLQVPTLLDRLLRVHSEVDDSVVDRIDQLHW